MKGIIKYVIFLLILNSCGAGSGLTKKELCSYIDPIFDIANVNMSIDVKDYENIKSNHDSVLIENNASSVIIRVTEYSNYPETLYVHDKNIDSLKVNIRATYYDTGKLFNLWLRKYEKDIINATTQKLEKYDKKGALIDSYTRGSQEPFKNIKVPDSVDIEEFKDSTKHFFDSLKNHEVKYKLLPLKNQKLYRIRELDKKLKVAKEKLYDEHGDIMQVIFRIESGEISNSPEIYKTVVYDSIPKIINHEEGYNICFWEAMNIAKKKESAEIEKYDIKSYSVNRVSIYETPEKKPQWIIGFKRNRDLNFPDKKCKGVGKIPYYYHMKYLTIDGVTGKIVDSYEQCHLP